MVGAFHICYDLAYGTHCPLSPSDRRLANPRSGSLSRATRKSAILARCTDPAPRATLGRPAAGDSKRRANDVRWSPALGGASSSPTARHTEPQMPSKHNRRDERVGFTCANCRANVPAGAFGTRHRNHCPHCLWSRHVDDETGDRRSPCRQPMEPIAIAAKGDGEWAIVHRCTGCGQVRLNRIAGDDAEIALLMLALRPLARPAFPLENLRSLGIT